MTHSERGLLSWPDGTSLERQDIRHNREQCRSGQVHKVEDGQEVPFRYSTLGLLPPIGKRTGVANILGVNFSGFIAWWLWRTIYLLKLPRFEKKVLVALDWTLDVLFSKDLVHFRTHRSSIPQPTEEARKKSA